MSFWAGIDPGMDGYVATLDDQGEVKLYPIPTLETGKGAKRRYNVPALYELAELLRAADLVALEKQQAMPGQGVGACFTTGFGYGLLCMGLAAAAAPHEEVSPARWKRAMGLSVPKGTPAKQRKKTAKALAVQKAQALYPGVSLLPTERSRKPSADMAEALLLARYARHRAEGLPL